MLQRFESSIRNRKLISRGEKILVTVSGGLDSMVLLHALKFLSAKYKWKIIVTHFNHQLRGRASDADEKLVRKTAMKLELKIIVGSEDVRQFAKTSKFSVEMAARRLRHRFFARVAAENKIRTVALAHHADDQVELFFLRLLRGAGVEGLAGMKWQSPSPLDKKISLIRPLLDFSKAELAAFAKKNKIPFREDATNFSSDFLRNRIRNELLPLLEKKYQAGLPQIILRLMAIIRAESDFIGDTAQKWISDSKIHFEKLPVAIQRRVLQKKITDLGFAVDFKLIEQLRCKAGVQANLWPEITVQRTETGDVILKSKGKPEFNLDELAVNLLGRVGEITFAGIKFTWQKVKGGKREAGVFRECFDADKIGGRVVFRHWRAGDRFQPIGMKSAKKLQDLFVNAKIPRERRRHLVLVAAENGEIFWVEGLRISEKFKVEPQTKNQFVWRWEAPPTAAA